MKNITWQHIVEPTLATVTAGMLPDGLKSLLTQVDLFSSGISSIHMQETSPKFGPH